MASARMKRSNKHAGPTEKAIEQEESRNQTYAKESTTWKELPIGNSNIERMLKNYFFFYADKTSYIGL
jgi:hypothetical protein